MLTGTLLAPLQAGGGGAAQDRTSFRPASLCSNCNTQVARAAYPGSPAGPRILTCRRAAGWTRSSSDSEQQ